MAPDEEKTSRSQHGAQDESAMSASERSSGDIAGLVQRDPAGKQSWRSYVWDSLDKSPAERRFLLKLDAALLTFA
jgi:MFS transporter, ACS family, pantothenate transporter